MSVQMISIGNVEVHDITRRLRRCLFNVNVFLTTIRVLFQGPHSCPISIYKRADLEEQVKSNFEKIE